MYPRGDPVLTQIQNLLPHWQVWDSILKYRLLHILVRDGVAKEGDGRICIKGRHYEVFLT